MTDFIRLSTFDVLGFSGVELTVFLAVPGCLFQRFLFCLRRAGSQ